MATIAKKSSVTATKKSPPPAARRLRGSPEKTERNAAIVAAVRAGASRIAVAAEHGISRERVGVILKNAAKAAPVSRKERNASIAAAAFAGEPYASIARRHGISDTRVSQIARAADPSYERRKPTLRAAIAADLGKMPVAEIATRHGVSQDYVRTIRRLDGIPSPRAVITSRVAELAKTRTVAQIAGFLDVSTKRVRNALKRAGVEARKPSYTRYIPPRTIDPNSMQSRIVGLAGDHTVEEIAEIVGKSKGYVRAALKNRRVFAKGQIVPPKGCVDLFAMEPKRPPETPPSVPEIAAAAVATELAKLPGRPDTDARVEIKPRRRGDDYSIAELRKAFPEFEIPAPVELPPQTVFVKPSAVYVAEVVARHGIDAAHERWPFLAFDELCELNREGAALISPPADEPLQPLGVRIWRALKRVFGRS